MKEYRRAADALFSEVGADFVALHVDRGQCFGMEAVSAAIWRLLETPSDSERLCARLVETYDVDPDNCRAEVERFLVQLHREGLVETIGDA